ncbi:MAG: GntR family transcriptional regulator [Eubacteriaceae bacterium]
MSNVLYIDIVNDVKNKITNGELKAGDLIQPEYELAEHYGVSRTTLRKSLALLVNEGYIYTIPGKGNYVCKPTGKMYQLDFDEIESLKVQIEDIELIDVKVISANKKLIEKLMIGPYDKIVRIRKAYKFKGKVVEYVIVYLPYEKGNPIVEDVIKFANFYDIMEKQNLHFQINKKLDINIIKADIQTSQFLSIDFGEPLFLITQEIYTTDKKSAISYNEFYILSNVLSINAETVL